MTLLEALRPTRPEPAAPDAPDPKARRKAREAAINRTLRFAVIALVVVAIAAGLFSVFDGPVANAWYTNRQHQLAGEWAAPHPHVGRGQAVGLLQIPKVGLDVLYADGDAPQQLRSGPGHRLGTVMPGEIGNSVIAGHRSAWGAPFGRLASLHPGDLIAVQTQSSSGPVGVFAIISVRQTSSHDIGPFANSTDRRLTIVTGTGGRFSDTHLVVTAVSGPVGHLLPQPATVHATTPPGSPIWNSEILSVIVALGLAGGLFLVMRRRYRAWIIAVVATPLVVLAVLALLLNIDAALPAVR